MLVSSTTSLYKLFFAGIVCVVKSQTRNETESSTCDTGTFYSRDYKMCVPCSACDVYSTQFSACTPTSDAVCVKCADTSQSDLADHPACLQCPPCQTGEYMETVCTANSATVCRPCPDGSFNSLPSYRTHCTPCASCENQIMIRDCNASMDTECGACKKGYFRDPHRNRCNRCALCYRGQVPIKECRNGPRGKLCSEYFFLRTDYVDVPVNATTMDTSTTTTRLLSSTAKISAWSSTDTVSLLTSSFNVFDVIIIVAVILSALVLIALIILLKYKLKMLTKTPHLHDYSEENSAMFDDDNFSHADEVQLFQNSAESTFTNSCKNQQCFTNHSTITENQELT